MTGSLLSRLSGNGPGVQGQAIRPLEVSKRLDDAKATLRALQLRYGPASFAAESGDPEAVAELAELNRLTRETEDRVRSLTATLIESQRIEEMQAAVSRENLYHSQASAVRAHLARAKVGAEKIAKAEALRAEGWREMITHMEKAKAACPVNFPWPSSYWPNLSELARLTQHETFRIGGEGTSSGSVSLSSLPGGAYSAEIGPNQPDRITPLVDVIGGYADRVSAQLKAHGDRLRGAA